MVGNLEPNEPEAVAYRVGQVLDCGKAQTAEGFHLAFWFEFSQLIQHDGGGFASWAGWENANVDDFVLSEIRILLVAISSKGKNLRWVIRKRDMRNNRTGFPLA